MSISVQHSCSPEKNQSTQKFLEKMHSHLKKGNDFEICYSSKDILPTNSRIHQIINNILFPQAQKQHLKNSMKFVANYIHSLPRKKPSITQDEKICETAKFLIRKGEKKLQGDQYLKDLKIQLLAYKLGVQSEDCCAPQNIGFLEFASRPPLERYLSEFDHELRIGEDGDIQLKQGNGYISWKTAKEITRPAPQNPSRYQIWTYGKDGVQNQNTFDWETLTPYKIDDPSKWDHKYILEFCCCCEDKPRFIGDHSWLRLKTPEGEIYSVGLYRPYKTQKSSKKDPLRIQKGILMQPDISEFWPITIHRIPFEITAEQFLKIKMQIETDKKEDEEVLEAFGRNCTQYVEKIASIAKIQLPLKKSMWRLLCHKYMSIKIVHLVDFFKPMVCESLSSTIAKTTSFWCGFALSCFGARKIDPEVCQSSRVPVDPTFKNFWDFFNPQNCQVKHPHTLGHDVKQQVFTSRAKQMKECLQEKMDLQLRNPENTQELDKLNKEYVRLKYS